MSHYQHKDSQAQPLPLSSNKVVCVGRNFAGHVRELGNELPESPLLFMKPRSALCDLNQAIAIPEGLGAVHYETELAVLLQAPLKNASEEQVAQAIWGYGIALDLTLRDLQTELKSKGQPWERAKAFDGACPVSGFIEQEKLSLESLSIDSFLNATLVQHLDPKHMLWKPHALIAYMSQCFSLEAGDIILTGTPEGVGALQAGDVFDFQLKNENRVVMDIRSTVCC